MFRTSGTIEQLKSITIFRIPLTTTSAPTGGRTTGVMPTNTQVTSTNTQVTPTSTRVTMINTRIPPKNTGGGAPQPMPRLRRGCLRTTAQKTRVTTPAATIPAVEATILAALEATITA